jgi:transposase
LVVVPAFERVKELHDWIIGDSVVASKEAGMTGEARYQEADRAQLSWDMIDLESQLASDHRARIVWAFVSGLELSALYASIRAREGEPGRPPPDPKIILALWLYATLEGVGSARQLDRLCGRDIAYRWLRGGVPVNYHGLSDFRFAHGEVLDRLLTESLTALLAAGIIQPEEIAIDGTKVRANAGKGSFRGADKLAALEGVARQRVAQLKAEVESDPAAGEKRRQAAQRRGAEDIARRAAEARHTLEKLRAEKAARAKRHRSAEAKKGEPRVSLTDPEARMMRFADGAVRAGYNIQLAVAPSSGIILATQATDRRNDAGLVGGMLEQVKKRLGVMPQRVLADTHYATKEDIVALAAQQITVYTPVPPDKAGATAESQRKRAWQRRREPDAIKAWRQRMADDASKAIYQRRARIETVNGILKGRGLGIMHLRSLAKVTCVVLLQALAHNLWRAHRLQASTA